MSFLRFAGLGYYWNRGSDMNDRRYCIYESYAEIVIGHVLLKSWIFYYPDGAYEQLIMRVKLQ